MRRFRQEKQGCLESQGETVTGEKQPLSAISVSCQSVWQWTSQDQSPSSSQAFSAVVSYPVEGGRNQRAHHCMQKGSDS